MTCACGREIDDGDYPECATCADEKLAEFEAANAVPVSDWEDEEREAQRNY